MDTWVLLRGPAREAGHWGGFVADLHAAMPGTRIHAVDLPGTGTLWRERSPVSVAAMVDSCRRQLARHAIRAPYRLLGLSLGGIVAAEWATAWPEEVAACVLVNVDMRPFGPSLPRLRYLKVLAGRLWACDRPATEALILGLTSGRPSEHPAVIDVWLSIREARPVSAANALRQWMAAALYRHPGPAPGVPVLVVNSTADRLVDPRCSEVLAARWSKELATHPSAGHDLPLDAGPWLAARVAGWYRGRVGP